LLFGLLLGGCLNPMPEEFPVRNEAPDRGASGPTDYASPTAEGATPPSAGGSTEPDDADVEELPEPANLEAPDAGADAAAPEELVTQP
jgi:hypothetical protein